MIKTIIFDLGGVVVGSFGKELIEYSSRELKMDASVLRALMSKYEPDLQKGTFDHVEFWKKILKEKGRNDFSDKVLKELWLKPYIEKAAINTEVMDIIKRLKERYIVGCVSNAQEPHNTYNRERGLLDNFDPCVLSSEVGMRKPEKEIFELYLQETGCLAKEAVFIDDEEKLLANAKEMGIHTILFKDAEQLKNELKALNIKF